MNPLKLFCLVGIILSIVLSCSINHSQPDNVRNALEKAGSNKKELELVIDHYKNEKDSLKLKAAYFLISNMLGAYYYDDEVLNRYHAGIPMIKENTDHFDAIMDSLGTLYGKIYLDKFRKKYDLEQLSSTYLINNIDMAFKVWEEQPWGKDINFNQFCEYILPYRIDNEKPEYDRLEIYNKYNPLLDSVRAVGGDAVLACTIVNRKLIKEGFSLVIRVGTLPHLGKLLLDNRIGSCREQTDLTVYVMRALGIPVSIDFTPQWPFRSMGHDWNTVLDSKGNNIVFMGAESNPGVPHNADYKKAKVYRRTFAVQPLSLAMIKNENEKVPRFFHQSRFIDVSDKYFQDKDVSLTIKEKNKGRFAYLAVSNNTEWIPIHWGELKDGTIIFSKMGRDICYLPCYEDLSPASYPVIVTKSGDIRYLEPNLDRRQSMKVVRKYPILNVRHRLERMVGGKFQGANKSDFSDAVDLYKIETLPSIFFEEIIINEKKSFRYLRYLTPPKGRSNIAELEFYSKASKDKPLHGKILGTQATWPTQPDWQKEKAMDGLTETFFDSPYDTAWVGIDLGQNHKQSVNKIRFIATNDDNNIRPGDVYELFYWDTNGWISLGKKEAKNYELIFENAPSNALYVLQNNTRGIEQRNFTYENGEQVWW